ncbi:transport ATP-binding protein CydC [Klebsiella pneumoniae]|nr:transport ATP-binding protein CydC [Klebsiella pneumoniae]
MRALLPYLALYKRHKWMLLLGVVLAIVTLLASIGLLTLSGWFLSRLSGGGRRRDLQF